MTTDARRYLFFVLRNLFLTKICGVPAFDGASWNILDSLEEKFRTPRAHTKEYRMDSEN